MKIKKILTNFMLFIIMMFSITSCVAPKEMVGKYNLTKITGIPGISASSYDYNYIILNSNYTYELENKIQGVVTAQEGKWSYDETTNELALIVQLNNSTSSKDIAIYNMEEKSFTLSTTIEGYTISMTMTLETSVE